MRTRSAAGIVVIGMVAIGAACGTDRVPIPSESPAAAPVSASEPVVLRAGGQVVAVDVAGDRLTMAEQDAAVSADSRTVATADRRSGKTTLRVLDADTGATRRSRELSGSFWPRTVSADGKSVVLLASPPASSADAYAPLGREETELVIVPERGPERRIRVTANIEPEAFALDGDSLFVVEFTPPAAPDRYRVRQLDLESGSLRDVFSADKELQEEMRGTARTQASSADGRRLYTLYSLEFDGHASAFIHVLDLDQQWAHCVDLPAGVGAGEAGSVGLALQPDGKRLDVIDASAKRVVVVDTLGLEAVSSRDVPALTGDRVVATSTPGGAVAVSTGTIVTLTADDDAAHTIGDDVGALRAIAVVGNATVGLGDASVVVLRSDGSALSRFALPWAALEGPPGGAIADGRQALQCAC